LQFTGEIDKLWESPPNGEVDNSKETQGMIYVGCCYSYSTWF